MNRILYSLSFFLWFVSAATADIQSFLSNSGLLAREYNEILHSSISRYKLNVDLSVNDRSENGGIEILVIRHKENYDYTEIFKTLFPAATVPKEPRDKLLNNAIYVGGRTIVVGELYFGQLVLSAANDYFASLQTEVDVTSGADVFEHASKKNNAIAAVLRLDNIELLSLYRSEERDLKGAAAIVAMARDVVKTAGSQADDGIRETLAGAFLPLLAHEIAHIDGSVEVAGLFEIIDSWRREKVRQREDAADLQAAAVVGEYLAAIQKSGNTTRLALASHGVRSYVALMRDKLLIEATQKPRFNDLRASDLFVELLHANCTDDPEMANYDYLSPIRVLSGRQKSLRDMILLKSADFEKMKERLVDTPRTRGHPHNFRRARLLLDVLKPFIEASQPDDLATFELLEAAMAGVTISGQERLPTFPISVRELEEKLADSYQFESAAWCPMANCRIGTPRDRSELGGVVELVGDDNSTYRLTWYAPVGLGDNDEYPQQLVRMTAFFLAITGRIEPMLVASETVRANRIQCGVGAGLWESEEEPYFVGMWSLFRPQWIVVQMQAKEVLEE